MVIFFETCLIYYHIELPILETCAHVEIKILWNIDWSTGNKLVKQWHIVVVVLCDFRYMMSNLWKRLNVNATPRNTVCPRMKLSKFWRHIAQKVRKIWQYPFVEQNVVVFWTCVPNISKMYWSLHKILLAIKMTHVWNHFPTFEKCQSYAWFYWGSMLYWPRYVVIVWSVFSLNVIVVVVWLV